MPMNGGSRRTMALLMVLTWLVQQVNAQQRVSADKNVSFTTPDKAFGFSYPSTFQLCTRGKIEPCIQSYIPVCDKDALVCVLYPAKHFRDTSFGAASFEVREIFRKEEEMTPDVCVTPYPRKENGRISETPDFLVSAEHPVEVIGGVQFLHGVSGGVASSNSIGTDLYRAFHRKRCFELEVNQTGVDPNVYDPPIKTL